MQDAKKPHHAAECDERRKAEKRDLPKPRNRGVGGNLKEEKRTEVAIALLGGEKEDDAEGEMEGNGGKWRVVGKWV